MNISTGKIEGIVSNDSNGTMNIGKENEDNDKLNITISSESPYFTNKGTLNIYSGNIKSNYSNTIINYGNITMKNGNITATRNGISHEENDVSKVITIEKGKIEATDSNGIAIYANGKLAEINIGNDDQKVEKDRVLLIGGSSSGGYGICNSNSSINVNFLDGTITANKPVYYKGSINKDTEKYSYYINNYELKEITNGDATSLVLSDKIPPETTVSVDKSKTSDKSITLNIKATDVGDGVDKFKVYYRDKSGSTYLNTGEITWKESENNINVYELSGLDANTTYLMKVVVFDKNGNEKESFELEWTTLANSITVTGISLNKNSTTIEVEKTETLTVTVMPENATNRNVTWTSSNVNVVKVNNGVLTAIAEGTATITATTEDGGKTATCQVTIVGKSVKSINITSEPTKTTYLKGEEIDLTGGMITITYDDDTTKDVEITKDMIAGYSKNEVKEQTITVTYGGKTATFKVTVKNDITGIEIKNEPTKTSYLKGEELDLTGGKITVIYENGDTQELDMKSSDISVTGYDANKLGEQTITVTYGGKTATFKVTVKNDVAGIVIKNKPTKTSYVKGEELDITGGMITVTYQDTTTANIPIAENMITGYDKNTLGEQVITVTYEGKTTTFKVTVKNDVTGIVIKNKPTKTSYVKGEELDITGGMITVTYQDTTTANIPIAENMITGYDKNTLGEQVITVTYEGKTTTFKVTVKNDVIDVVIVNIPNQIIYEKGKDLDLSGGKVKVVYENGKTEELEMKSADISITGYNANKLGEQTITVKYGGKIATFKVTVKAASASNGNGNSSTNGNNNNNNSNSNKNQQSATKKDNTTANIILPKTGIGKIMLGIIVLLTVGGVTYIRFRKLNDIK